MQRRNFLKLSGTLLAQSLIASSVMDWLVIPNAHGAMIPVRDLKNSIAPEDGVVLLPQDSKFTSFNRSWNLRTLKTPVVRVLCNTPLAAQTAIQWAQANSVPFAMRAGGHSFEGFSQSTGLVIDVRPMSEIEIADDRESFVVGAGAMLGNVYRALSKQNRALPAGSCPTVGITGHTLGGGYGLLARPLGLACDSLIGVEMVNAAGEIVNVSEKENADLFWALRGGGAGQFGVVTQLHFKTHRLKTVVTYTMRWKVSAKTAAALMKTWQEWAPESPREITSLMHVGRIDSKTFSVRAVGQSTGSVDTLKKQLAVLAKVAAPEASSMRQKSFMEAVEQFAGSFESEYIFMKGKSDYIKSVMTDEGISQFPQQIPAGIAVIFDSYGGAIRDLGDADTAFAHRSKTVSSLQYYSQWSKESQTQEKLQTLRRFHDAMRPHVSGSAYFNYCDLDLKDYARAYWGTNLEKLVEVKAKYDAANFFKHAQSIPTSLIG